MLMSSNSGSTPSTSQATGYWNINGVINSVDTTQGNRVTKLSYAGTLYGFGIRLRTNSLAAGPGTFKITKNNSDTVLSISVSTGQTGWFENTSDTVSISANDLIEVKHTLTGGEAGTFRIQILRTEYDTNTSTTNTISVLKSDGTGSTGSGTTYYGYLGGLSNGTNTTEANAQAKLQYAATLRNLRVNILTNTRTTSTTIRTRVNGANGNMSVTIPASPNGTGWFEDTSNTDTIAANDLVCIQVVNGASTETAPTYNGIQIDHQTTTDPGKGLLMVTNVTEPYFEPTTTYQEISGQFGDQITESQHQVELLSAFTFKGMAVKCSANTVNSTTPFRLRKNTANSSVVVNVTTSSTSWHQDTTNSESCAVGDLVNFNAVLPSVSGSQSLTARIILIYTEIAGVSGPVATTEVSSTTLTNRFIIKV